MTDRNKEEYLRLKAINDKRQVADIRRQNEEWEKEARDEKAARVAALNREIAAREAMAKSRIDETLRRKALKDRQDLEELEKVKREIAEEEVKQKQRVVNERLRLEAIMAENVAVVCQVSASSSSGSRATHCPDRGDSIRSREPLRVSTRDTRISENSLAIEIGAPTRWSSSR